MDLGWIWGGSGMDLGWIWGGSGVDLDGSGRAGSGSGSGPIGSGSGPVLDQRSRYYGARASDPKLARRDPQRTHSGTLF